MVPLAEMHGYATAIRSMSQGRSTYYMEADHYEPVPAQITAKIVETSGFTGRVEH